MLSFYDAMIFGLQKKSLFGGFIFAAVMLCFFVLIGWALESNFALFSTAAAIISSQNNSALFISNLNQLGQILMTPEFWGMTFQKTHWAFMLFVGGLFAVFTWEVIVAKKTLFNQPPNFSLTFFVFTFAKMMLLLLPILAVLYFFSYEMFKSAFEYLAATVFGLKQRFHWPFSMWIVVPFALWFFCYFVYTTLLFIGRFSFSSLLHGVIFFKHFKTVLELFAWWILNHIIVIIAFVALFAVCYFIDSLWVCFMMLIFYLLMMLVFDQIKFICLLPFAVIAAGALGLQTWLGRAFFNNYILEILIGGLVYFTGFFVLAVFTSVLAHLFAQTAFVFHFDKTPASDAMERQPDHTKRIDELYNEYLTEHNNQTQSNFFDKM